MTECVSTMRDRVHVCIPYVTGCVSTMHDRVRDRVCIPCVTGCVCTTCDRVRDGAGVSVLCVSGYAMKHHFYAVNAVRLDQMNFLLLGSSQLKMEQVIRSKKGGGILTKVIFKTSNYMEFTHCNCMELSEFCATTN